MKNYSKKFFIKKGSEGGQTTKKLYGIKHYKKMAEISHKKRVELSTVRV